MYRIRFHGRGGQGMKTASRILGTAFFLEGFEVQDAPRYGAERRGAPIFAFVRANRQPIFERGIIRNADLVVVADDTLVGVPAAGVLAGLRDGSVILINTSLDPAEWQRRLNTKAKIITLPVSETIEDRAELRYAGATCAGAAARLLGVIGRDNLDKAIRQELAGHGEDVIAENIARADHAYDAMATHTGIIEESANSDPDNYTPPEWIELPFEGARISAPVIHAGLTSIEVRTGLWRTLRPDIDYERCSGCWWVCSTFCPDSAIKVEAGKPVIDYDHCKGCMICVAQCPPHAISAVAEQEAAKRPA